MIGTQKIPLPGYYKQMLPGFIQRTPDVSFVSKRRLEITDDEIHKAGIIIKDDESLVETAFEAWNESGGDKAYVAFTVRQIIIN